MSIPALMFKDGGWCEALKSSYRPGPYQPRTVEEFNALAPFAVLPAGSIPAAALESFPQNSPDVEFDVDGCTDREELAGYATKIGVTFHHKAGIEKIREAVKAFRQGQG